ncbi:MAG: response regulator [Vulcanimicrobiota bacterium]
MQSPFRILILEDDEVLRRSMSGVLEEEGYQVVAVGRGLEAVEEAQHHEFDLIVTDIRMAGMDGLEALAQVKESRPEICSMVVTGYSTEADSVRAIQLGVQEYLRKPFRLNQFLEGVRRLSGRKLQERAVQTRESALLHTSLWSLEVLARQVPCSQPGGLVGVGRLAARTAAHLGLAPEVCEECQFLTLAGLLTRLATNFDSAGLLQALPNSSRSLLELALERWDGKASTEEVKAEELPWEVRVSGPLIHFPERLGKDMETLAPAAFDPQVVKAFGEVAQQPVSSLQNTTAEAAAARRRRSLLSLARMLEEGGELESASRAYQAVLGPQTSREGAQALVGLTRLAARLAEPARQREFSERSLQTARLVGPACLVQTGLEVAWLQSAEEAQRTLEEVVRMAQLLGLSGAQARARLAQCHLARKPLQDGIPECLQVLSRPEHHQECSQSADWLLELLAWRQTQLPDQEKLLVRLARLHPASFERLLTQNHSQEVRQAVARLSVQDRDLAAAVARRWQADAAIAAILSQAGELATSDELPRLHLHLLGPLEIFRAAQRVPDKAWKTQKNRYFLACVAAHGRPLSEDFLIEEFWPNDPATGKANLWSTLSNLRKALRPAGWTGPELEYVVKTKGGYQLNPDLPVWQDLLDFQSLLQQAQEVDPGLAIEKRRQAVQLYRGPLLEGCYMEWALTLRSRLERLITDNLRQLSHDTLAAGLPLEALEHSHRLMELDSCCQEAYLLGMQANMALKRPEESIRLYEACQKILKRELALEPSLELFEAFQRARLAL